MSPHLSHDPHTPFQPELFSEEILQPCLEHELGRLERNWKTGDFDHGWRAAALEHELLEISVNV